MSEPNNEKLKITLKKSLSGRFNKHVKTAISLGLRKIGQTVIKYNTPLLLGKLKQIKYLIDISIVQDNLSV